MPAPLGPWLALRSGAPEGTFNNTAFPSHQRRSRIHSLHNPHRFFQLDIRPRFCQIAIVSRCQVAAVESRLCPFASSPKFSDLVVPERIASSKFATLHVKQK